MIDHVGLAVTDYRRSFDFYSAALAPLGYALVEEHDRNAGFGPPGKPLFWLHHQPDRPSRTHVAFVAANRADVRGFYEAALAAGAADNGAPGLRTIYHPHYYGAFVIDPDGNNVEAVCHLPDPDGDTA